MNDTQLKRYIRDVPKAELHVHLEGSIQPATVLTLARRNGVELPVNSVEEMQQWFKYRDFNHFIDIYLIISSCLKTADDYELIAYEFGANMARQHARYAEITFSPGTHAFVLGVPFETYFSGLTRGRQRARDEFGVEMRWIFDIVRNVEDEARNSSAADYTTSVAIEGKQDGVVALGLGGAEIGYPPERFERWFKRARGAGLHCIPHAGETDGPASVWGALKALGAERVGHGVRSIEDPALVSYLAEQRIPLEVCPTSNIRLGVYASMTEHPLPRLHAAGVPVTINSDDPPLFNTMLNDEAQLLVDPFHFDLDTINEIILNGVRYSFLSADEKKALQEAFRAEMAQLRETVEQDE